MKVWNTLKTTYKVSDFIGWKKDGSLQLNPFFQRRSVWKTGAKSYLIDTIIKGFPIPIIFVRDKKSSLKTYSPIREVVDGQQRLRTVIAFVQPELLDKVEERDVFTIEREHNKQFAGLTFRQLPESVRSQILDYQFSVNVFPSDTADGEVKQVFARMNSSGYRLNGQELRNAEFFGAFKTLAYELATEQLSRFRMWRVFTTDNLARMLEVEMSSEFLIVMLQGISDKNDKIIDSIYRDWDEDFPQSVEATRRFTHIFDQLDKCFGDDIPRLFKKRTLFFALWVAVYYLSYGEAELTKKKVTPAKLRPGDVAGIVTAGEKIESGAISDKIKDATTRRTTHVPERRALANYLLRNTGHAIPSPE